MTTHRVGLDLGGATEDPVATVIICTTRNAARLERCLSALAAGAGETPHEVVIVLNGADEDVVGFVRKQVTGATVVESEDNLGFAGGANLGRRSARAPLLVLLHDDAVLQPDALSHLVTAADRHPEAGIIGPLVLDMDGRISNAGPILFRDGISSTANRGDDPQPVVLHPRLTDYCGTSCVLIRATTWDACEGFDERFYPAGYADVDLAFTARRLGWSVRFEPSAIINHDSGSLTQGFKEWVFTRNREQFLAKWHEDLKEHEPSGDDTAEALERAVGRAARRGPVTDAPRELPARNAASADRGRHREARLLRSYAAELEAEVAARREEVVQRNAELTNLHAERDAELTSLRAQRAEELQARDAHIHALVTDLGSLNRAAAIDAAEIRRLQDREATLNAIVASRWWRLRARLLPALRLFQPRRR